MRMSATRFREWEHKSVTLLGMSGVGKTWLSNTLRQQGWFHYSGDYRIGTRYLDEPILDTLKQELMQVPRLRDLLRSDSIYIRNNLSVDNLAPLSSFLGMIGNPEQGGLPLKEFKRRQKLHHDGEVAAMLDVPAFIEKSQAIYGYPHFVNDAGGSLCELQDPSVMELLARHTLVLYIRATEADEKAVLERAVTHPKPMYYREAFLDEHLPEYLAENDLEYVAQVDPEEFVRWVFPRLFYARVPRYEALAHRYGYVVTSDEVAAVKSEDDFVDLVCRAIERHREED